jgi:peptidoglycan/LPS O-acetylase OafA/YrhL
MSMTAVNPLVQSNAVAPARTPGERFHQLDGLRAVAVGIVMIHHAFTGPVANALRATERPGLIYLADLLHAITGSGVELFFVLSGVVLLRPYVRGLRPFKPGTYFLRRIERLWPPYLVVLALEALVTYVATTWPTTLSRGDRGFGFSLVDLARQLPIVNFGSPFWNMAWWSLSVEVLFYLCVPVVLPLFIWREMNRVLLVVLAVLLWAGGIAVQRSLDDQHVMWYDSFQKLAVYSLCFLTGIAIAKFDWHARVGWALVGAGLMYLLAAIAYPAMNFHNGFALLYGGLVMLAFVPQSLWKRALGRDLMVWVGERSYSLFLIHFTMFFAVNYAVSWLLVEKDWVYFLATRTFGIPLAVLGAMVLFQLVERRFARNLVTANQFWPPV